MLTGKWFDFFFLVKAIIGVDLTAKKFTAIRKKKSKKDMFLIFLHDRSLIYCDFEGLIFTNV